MGLALDLVLTALMVCIMGLAIMVAMLAMAHMECGKDLCILMAQDQRGLQNLLDLAMGSDMEVTALVLVDLVAMGLDMASMVMVSTAATIGKGHLRTRLPSRGKFAPRDLQAPTMALAWDRTTDSATVVMVWEGYMGMVFTVAISGRGLLRMPSYRQKPAERGPRVLTMALALARIMALDMAWEVFTAGTDSMAMGSGGAPQMRMKQMR